MVVTKCLWLWLTLTLVTATPECKNTYNKGTDVVCSNSDEDYVLSRGLVSDANRTTAVTLRACRITNVEYESFENMPSLKYIDLSQNKISELQLGVLDGISTVTHLNLSHNWLSKFPLGLFDQMPNLSILDLNSNRLAVFELGVFDPLEKLTYISLSNNLLRGDDLDAYVFDRNTQITYFDMSRNSLNDAPFNLLSGLQVLETLILDKCLLYHIPSFAVERSLKSLKRLSLSRNYISKINSPEIFVKLDNLETLDLSENNIESIDENVFKPLRKLKAVTLRRNKLNVLPETLFQNLRHLVSIDLSGNLISNVNVNTFHGSSVKNLNLANNKITYLVDNFCLELKNFGAKLTKFYFNQNPWQCSCLKDVLNEVKRLGIVYNSNSYDGSHAVCVTTEEYYCKRHDDINSIYIQMYNDLILNS